MSGPRLASRCPHLLHVGMLLRPPVRLCLLHVGARVAPCPALVPCSVLLRVPRRSILICARTVSQACCSRLVTPTCMQAGPATAANSYCRWVPLQHVQHQIYFLKHLEETFATYVWNSWNTCKHTSETRKKHMCSHYKTYATSRWNTYNICVKHMQYPDETLVT
jgi:hypothetical protein